MRAWLLISLVANPWLASPQEAAPWRDPSPHRVHFVAVGDGVQLEVLDWGGAGRPVVLLAGLGNTAHVYDEFAPKLTPEYHVYGITRRGFGSSSWPASGYTDQRLAADVLGVVERLRLAGTLLVGHSIAGQELSFLGANRSEKIAGLVYLDAAADDLTGITEEPQRRQIMKQLPAPEPAASDRRSFPELRVWYRRVYGIAPPEAELRQIYETTPAGGAGKYRQAKDAWSGILAGVNKPDYARIRLPALAIYAVPRSAGDVPPWLRTEDPDRLAVIEEAYAFGVAARARAIRAFQSARHSRVVLLPGADHFVFLSHEADVLGELRLFLAGLP